MTDHTARIVLEVDGTKWRNDGVRWQYQQHYGGWCDAPEAFCAFLDRIAELQDSSEKARVEIIERLEDAVNSVWGRKDVIKKLQSDLQGANP